MQKFEHLVVCGDSYQTPSRNPEFFGTHWSEILAARHEIKLVTLASPGMSDTGIAFQIMEAAKYPNALIVISMSAGLRLDLCSPNNTSKLVSHYTHFKSQATDQAHTDNYIQVTSVRSLDLDNAADRVLLTCINYDLEEFKQRSMIFYALTVLRKQSDNFLFFENVASGHKNNISNMLDEKNIISRQQFDLTEDSIYHNETSNWQDIDPGYHTLPKRQTQVADYIENRIWNGVR